jgi:hypothetical protein
VRKHNLNCLLHCNRTVNIRCDTFVHKSLKFSFILVRLLNGSCISDRTFTKALGKRPKNPTSVITAEAIETDALKDIVVFR